MPRFQVGWAQYIPFLGYNHVLMILIAIAIILLCKSSTQLAIIQPDANVLQHYYSQDALHHPL